MSSFWLEVLLAFVCAGAAGLLTWFFSNAAGACAVGLTILLLFGVHHFRQLSRLLHWLEQPLGTPVPGGGGAWELVFAALHRRARKSAGTAAAAADSGASAKEIRDWARSNGHEVPERGRIPAAVREAFDAAS